MPKSPGFSSNTHTASRAHRTQSKSVASVKTPSEKASKDLKTTNKSSASQFGSDMVKRVVIYGAALFALVKGALAVLHHHAARHGYGFKPF
ncbi:MAG: hypothetical protein VKJ06_06490 [Vampirovibrionales bacterium]|nr:hypothetical protein [Vampirovibrionales bacterium]